MEKPSYQLALFDFDGLLVDTERLHFIAYQQMCQGRGFSLNWDFATFCRIAHHSAEGLKEAVYAHCPRLRTQEPSWSVLYQEKKAAYEALLEKGELLLMPGVAPFLERLAVEEICRAVVTNSTKRQVELIRNFHPILNSIPLWITREDYPHPKPAPDGYRLAMERLSIPKERSIGFEDSLKGLQSLCAAGAKGILICPSTHPQMKDPFCQGQTHFTTLEEAAASFHLSQGTLHTNL